MYIAPELLKTNIVKISLDLFEAIQVDHFILI
jgi:hypothetical protein